MPLSEDEQRILAEIERNLHESDPRLAREVGQTTVYRHALGSLRWSALWLILGLVLEVALLQVHYMAAFAGAALMFVGAFGLERNLRLMGRVGLDQFSRAFRSANPSVRQAGQDRTGERDFD